MGPPWDNPEIALLAIPHLDNQLYILRPTGVWGGIRDHLWKGEPRKNAGQDPSESLPKLGTEGEIQNCNIKDNSG